MENMELYADQSQVYYQGLVLSYLEGCYELGVKVRSFWIESSRPFLQQILQKAHLTLT